MIGLVRALRSSTPDELQQRTRPLRPGISVAHPDYRPLLEEYYERALKNPHQQTPHYLRTAFDFHINLAERGSMNSFES